MITLQLDFEITPELIGIYQDATKSAFIGYDKPLSLEEATQKMHQYASTKRYGKFERLAIMKIWKGDELVGFSLPRKIADFEYRSFKIEDTNLDWYRLGTIYIVDKHRGQGINSKVVELFKDKYLNIVWQCEQENISSSKAALNAGLQYSHHIYFKDSNLWSFDSDHEFVYGYAIFKSSGVNNGAG